MFFCLTTDSTVRPPFLSTQWALIADFAPPLPSGESQGEGGKKPLIVID